MADKKVTVKEFADYFQFEQLTGDEQSLRRSIELTDTNRPGLELAGFFDYSGQAPGDPGRQGDRLYRHDERAVAKALV